MEENKIWTEHDETTLSIKLKHLIKVLELKKNKITLEEYLKFIQHTKTDYERQKYIQKLSELLELDMI